MPADLLQVRTLMVLRYPVAVWVLYEDTWMTGIASAVYAFSSAMYQDKLPPRKGRELSSVCSRFSQIIVQG